MAITQSDVRDAILKELIQDLLGPEKPNEELDEGPITHYLTGILYPSDTTVDAEEDQDSSDAAPNDDDEVDTGSLMASATNPSSIGLTFITQMNEEIEIRVAAAIYLTGEDVTARREIWARKPLEIEPVIIKLDESKTKELKLVTGLELHYRVRQRENLAIVTLSLVNRLKVSKNARLDPYCFFQPEIVVKSIKDGKEIFLPRIREHELKTDPDKALNSLLYAHAPEFSVGHGCATEWKAEERRNATEIKTVIIPTFEILQLSPDPKVPYQAQSMKFLAEKGQGEVVSALNALLKDYETWITGLNLNYVPESLKEVADKNIGECKQAASRIREGINLLTNDRQVFRAFQLANRAMLTQRARITWLKTPVEKRLADPVEDESHLWRPFQLAFILLSLSGIANPRHSSRGLVDLLWFPTGGGKTEAYLGLTAFTIFLRKISGKGSKESAGVTVLMRYTLRLLTIQQFQRASSLILACECLRRQFPGELGAVPISLGLWVGGKSTPNWLKQTIKALDKLKVGEDLNEGNPYQVLSCPWCGSKLTPNHYSVGKTMVIRCPNKGCDFNSGMPLYLVDEDVYTQKPSLLLGTVDKFARLPWVEESGAIFGKSKSGNLPPDLIIQDELHLISGPLGTLVGLYETAVDLLCEQNGIPSKVIASTATIRRASEQSRNLFNRGFSQFPPPSIDARNNFFSVQVPRSERPGRLYVGIHAPGKSIKTTLLRTCAILLQRISEIPADEKSRDPYWTLVNYFNSLRELGGALRLVEDDIRERMKLLAKRRGVRQRILRDPRELNSRCGAREIPEILEILDSPIGSSNALDVLLATNMISVGVDIDRLGLMVVNGQPKTTSEYIQATSRVGRKFPGLVITVYNWTRPRDRSHYERFKGYHSSIYSQVEPTSVTPFSSRARDRGLHGVFISLIRHSGANMSPEDAAKRFKEDSPEVAQVIQKILDRVEQIDPDEVEETREQLLSIVERWSILAEEKKQLLYGEPYTEQNEDQYNGPSPDYLMTSAEKAFKAEPLVFPTLNSLRDVEGESGIFIKRERKNNAKA